MTSTPAFTAGHSRGGALIGQAALKVAGASNMPTLQRFADPGRGIPVLVALACLSLPLAAGGSLSPAPAAAPVELRLPDLDGQERSLDELKGKVVLVSFWASWCTPCLEEMPSIQRLAEDLRDKPFAVIGVNVGESPLRVKTMVRRLGIGFPVLLDRDSAVFDRWGATVLPTTYVLDAEGVVRFVGRGPLEWDSNAVMSILEGAVGAEAAVPSPYPDPSE
ncbi:TlpA disulfide reductase family protein [uncultured Thiocystis sp.]|jgi:thiol-disulfide isomerase/thioredoxin|uniref:TlpA disulfide reductase family protein n=1 Tax=uncultured Thiocystis sp. TaxID=1202134 RepID=UPI0025E87135|nr:TlpA disulfide reductase family protein [uncultured Thiocystis sp.]